MGLPKRLTDMQKRFAEYYVFGDPATGKVCSKADAAKLDVKVLNLQIQDTHHL